MFESLMGRIALSLLALAGAIAALFAAILLPVHLRAVDPRVLESSNLAGKSFLQIIEETARRNPATAKLLLHAAENLEVEGTEKVVEFLRESAESSGTHSAPRTRLQEFEYASAGRVEVAETPVLNALRRPENRQRLAASLHSAEAGRILQNRSLTNFVLFAPVRSGAGFPLDASIITTAFLMEQGAFGANVRTEPTLKEEVLQLAARGASTNQIGALENLYLDIFALAKRLSSEQLIAFVSSIQNFAALDYTARYLQEHSKEMPLIFSAVVLSRDGRGVAEYLRMFPDTATADLGFALAIGPRALTEVITGQQPIYRTRIHNQLMSSSRLAFLADPFLRFAVSLPLFALLTKWLLLFLAGLALAYAVRIARATPEEETPNWVPEFGVARRMTFAVVFLALTVLLGEPYLAQGEPEEKPAVRVSFPVFSAVTPPPVKTQTQSSGFMINPSTLIAMGVFLVLQGSIYLFCLTKLGEIRRQPLSGPMKLKLLENEENLFDAGLYLGLFGTAASLILLTLGLIKPSLVSAYSSTLFGILFVALLKIFHVRPYKRRLLIESFMREEAA